MFHSNTLIHPSIHPSLASARLLVLSANRITVCYPFTTLNHRPFVSMTRTDNVMTTCNFCTGMIDSECVRAGCVYVLGSHSFTATLIYFYYLPPLTITRLLLYDKRRWLDLERKSSGSQWLVCIWSRLCPDCWMSLFYWVVIQHIGSLFLCADDGYVLLCWLLVRVMMVINLIILFGLHSNAFV